MQEHIRRAHPEHYISKLPATEESFLLMINTPPSERRHADQASAPGTQGSSNIGTGYEDFTDSFCQVSTTGMATIVPVLVILRRRGISMTLPTQMEHH